MEKTREEAKDKVLAFGITLLAVVIITTVLANKSGDVEKWDLETAAKLANDSNCM